MKERYKVYFLKDHKNKILYVGETGKATVNRFNEHCETKYWIDNVSEVDECAMENLAQCKVAELIYINLLKPMFNIKDKCEGKVYTKLRPRDKYINHSFYAIDGRVTECIPYFKEDYALIDSIIINNKEVGLYYDYYMNLYCSVSDLCKAYKVKEKKINLFELLTNDDIVKVTYSIEEKGVSKNKTQYLCSYNGINKILPKTKNIDELTMAFEKFHLCFYGNYEEAENKIQSFLKALEKLDNNNCETITKRRLIYKSIKNNISLEEQVKLYNESKKEYNFKRPMELLKNEIFSYMDELATEYNLTQGDISKDFADFLRQKPKYKNINLWNIKEKIVSDYPDQYKKARDVPTYLTIALYQDILQKPFMEYYKIKMRE